MIDKQVVIDGVEYVPKSTVVSGAAMKKLSEAYGIAWVNGHYDPPCEHETNQGQFRKVANLLSDVNSELGFKK